MQFNGNYSVTTSSNSTSSLACVNTNKTPCFSIQLTTTKSGGGGYQWVFFILHGNSTIAACATSNASCTPGATGNECSINEPADGFSADTFYIKFTSATAYSMEISNNSGSSSCTPGSANLTGLDAWEVSGGIGYGTPDSDKVGACALWATDATISVAGFAPSGVTFGSVNDAPGPDCITAGNAYWNGGNALWVVSGVSPGVTGEGNNLDSWSWSYSSAQDFVYSMTT